MQEKFHSNKIYQLKKLIYTHVNFRRTADDVVHFTTVYSKAMYQFTRVEVPQFDGEVSPPWDQVVSAVGLAVRVWVQEWCHVAMVTL